MASDKPKREIFACHCGDHVWFTSPRGWPVLVSPEDASIFEAPMVAVSVNKPKRKTKIHFDVSVGTKRNMRALHRVILNAMPDQWIDHANGNGHDARRSNLRPCTPATNAQNKAFVRVAGTSLFKGVERMKDRPDRKPFKATINAFGKRYFLGYFETEEAAALAYNAAALKHHGEFAVLNVIGRPGAAGQRTQVRCEHGPRARRRAR